MAKTKTTSKSSPTPRARASQVDKVDTTLDKSETKVRPSKASTSAATGGIRLDPNLRMIPGNTVTFVAEYRPGRVQAKIVTTKDSWIVAASTLSDDSRVSKILEVPGEITVEFFEDGEQFASGTWTVG